MTPATDPLIPASAEPGLSLEGMKRFVLNHFEEFVNRKNTDFADFSFSPDFVDHNGLTGVAVGPEAAKAMMDGVFQRWPDLRVTVEDMIAEGDRVVVRNVSSATEAKDGTRIEIHGFVLSRFASGKIVEQWATLTPPRPAPLTAEAAMDPALRSVLRETPVKTRRPFEQLLAELRLAGTGFNPPAKEEDLACLQELTGPLPEDLLRLYRDHDGMSAVQRPNLRQLPARLMPIDLALRTHEAFIPVLDAQPSAGNLILLWTDDNSNYCGLYTDGPLQGWLAVLNHDEPVLVPAFRSTTAFLERFLFQTEDDADEDQTAPDLPSLRPQVPAMEPDLEHDEADATLASEFFDFSEEQDDEDSARFCTLCGICLTPFDHTADLLPLLETDDMWTPEAVVTLMELRNFQGGVDNLEELARSGSANGDGAPMRLLFRMNTESARQALGRLKMTLSEPKLRLLLMWERRADSLLPPRWP